MQNNGVDMELSLGASLQGRSAGSLRLRAETPSAANLGAPSALEYTLENATGRGGISVARDATDAISSIISPSCFVQVTVDDAYSYHIDFYSVSAVSGEYVPDLEDGFLASWSVALSPVDSNNLFISRFTDLARTTAVASYEYICTDGDRDWNLITRDDGRVVRTEELTWTEGNEIWARTYEVHDGSNNLTRSESTLHPVIGTVPGKWTTRNIVTGGNAPQLTTSRDFYPATAGTWYDGALKWQENFDGSWEWYFYQDTGSSERKVIRCTGWLEQQLPASISPEEAAYWPTRTVTTYASGRVALIEEYANEALVRKTEWTGPRGNGDPPAPYENRYSRRSAFLQTTTEYDEEHRPTQVQYPDGRIDSYVYYTSADFDCDSASWALTYEATGGDGTYEATVIIHRGTNEEAVVVDKSTKDVIVRDRLDRVVMEATYAYVSDGGEGSTAELLQWIVYEHDSRSRVTDKYYSDYRREHTKYDDCCSRTVTDTNGVTTEYVNDALGRPQQITRTAMPGFTASDNTFAGRPQSITTYDYSVFGQVTEIVSSTSSDGATPISRTKIRVYDLAGRLIEERTGNDINTDTKTLYAYELTDYGHQVTVYRDYPLSATAGTSGVRDEVTEYYRDGRVRRISGALAELRAYQYSVDDYYGLITTTILIGTDNPALTEWPRWTRTARDMLGRTESESRPTLNGQNVTTSTTEYEYYPDNQLGAGQIKSRMTTNAATADQTVERYVYNEMGQLVRTGLDIDGGGLDPSVDRVTDTETKFVLPWQETTTTVYPVTDQATSRMVQVTRRRVSGLSLAVLDQTQELTLKASGDPEDPWTTSTTTTSLNRITYNPATTTWPAYQTTTSVTTGATTAATQISYDGLTLLSSSRSGATTKMTYDGLGRETRVDGPRPNVWHGTIYDANSDRVTETRESCSTALQASGYSSTFYEYYGGGAATEGAWPGRLWYTTNPNAKDTYYAYDARGEIWRVWGDVPQPVEMNYLNIHPVNGEIRTLTTYRAGEDWDEEAWPGASESGDTTTWVYSAAAGLLTAKTDADGKSVGYQYYPNGRLQKRTWGRGVETTYTYSAAGEPATIDYSDTTSWNTDITFAYDRLGRLLTVTAADPNSTDHAFNYDQAPQQVTETITGLFNRVITRQFMPGGGEQLGNLTVGTEYAAGYQYDASTGRLSRVTGPGLPGGSGDDYGANYVYYPGSDLVYKTQVRLESGTLVGMTLRRYESERDLIQQVQNCFGSWEDPPPDDDHATVSRYTCTNDLLARRAGVEQWGYAPDSASVAFNYNDRNELTNGTRTGASWAYGYDPIGSRATYTEDTGTPVTTSYLTNELDQYYRADATGGAELRQGLRYDADGNLVEKFVAADMNCDGVISFADINTFTLALQNATEYQSQYPTCNILNGDINGDGQLTFGDLNPFVALLGNGVGAGGLRAEYTWDAENRLVRVGPADDVTPADGMQRVTYVYDYLGRRIAKGVQTYYGAGGGWITNPADQRRFVWSGWLMLEELDNANEVLRQYTWGLDLAGQNGQVNGLDRAGGIGGLLAMCDPNNPSDATDPYGDYLYFHDANGNVVQLMDWTLSGQWPGALAARYDYDPYGNNLLDPADPVQSGAYAAANPFRFSSKYCDAETGLGYWGYRYYDPRLGRWISRDPIEEEGGTNLYGYVGNRPADHVDVLGRMWLVNQSNRSEVCCKYAEPKNMGFAMGVTLMGETPCNKTVKCPNGPLTAEGCCECGCRSRDGTSGRTRTVIGASWGPCCWCTLTIRSVPAWTALARWRSWHHVLVLQCPSHNGGSPFTALIDLYQGQIRHLDSRKRPAATADAIAQHAEVVATVKIGCDTAETLSRQWDTQYPNSTNGSDLYFFPFYQCRTFAFDGLDHVGGPRECPP